MLLGGAARLGLETEYWNAFGELRAVSPDVLKRLVEALAPATQAQMQILPRSMVMRGRGEKELRLPGAGDFPVQWQIVADHALAAGESAAPVIAVPPDLGNGVFRLQVTARTSARDLTDSAALHEALEPPLLELGCYRREERQYTPHLTLGRLRRDPDPEPFAAALAKQARWRGGTAAVTELLVLSSELRSKGPEYTVLGRGKLRRPGRQPHVAEGEVGDHGHAYLGEEVVEDFVHAFVGGPLRIVFSR